MLKVIYHTDHDVELQAPVDKDGVVTWVKVASVKRPYLGEVIGELWNLASDIEKQQAQEVKNR